ncbi:hypothetical protein [Lysinibacillus sp. FN11]|nr:hypothetical protein [Lysinibacillus sp. FN11]UUV23320.1 hypothetical protein NP781_15715 [Lysinibacillus sp. FN11]
MFIKPYEEAKMTLGLRSLVRRLIPNHPSLDQMKRSYYRLKQANTVKNLL